MARRLTLGTDELEKIGTPAPRNQKLSLGDLDKAPRRVVGAGWKPPKIAGEEIDLDLVTALLSIDTDPEPERTESGLCVASRDRLVHYNPQNRKLKVRDASGAVEYQGDSRDGRDSDEDEDEFSIFDFSLVPDDVVALMTFVNIHKQGNSTKFVRELTFDVIDNPFVSSFKEGTPKGSPDKRVIGLNKFGGTDTVIVKFDWRNKDDANIWEEEFVEKHVAHLPDFEDLPNAGFVSALVPYGFGV
jgi:stress response protein SCP2